MRFGLRRRLGIGLAVLAATAVAVTGLLLAVAFHCHATLAAVDHDAGLARRARALGVFAREQYIHEAHTIILADRSHVGHQGAWVEQFRASVRSLSREVTPEDRARLGAIVARSAALQRVFADEILPAVDRGDRAAVHEAHERAESLVADMIAAADALGDRFERRARESAARSDAQVRVAGAVSVALALLAALVALAVARRVWGGIAAPLARLHAVAGHVASGDTAARVGPLPPDELAVVGEAFDQMLDRLARREAELVQAERLAVVGRVAAGVAHEINNPIGVIRGYLKTMFAEASADAPLRAELAILDEEALACQRIAEDLLTYARVPALDRQPTDPRALVGDVLERLRAAAELGDCDVAADVEPATLELDPLRTRQVVANLLRNASQAVQGRGTLEVVGRARGEGYELVVSDRGPGVAAQVRAHLFEPFATTRAGGTGLGLAVCDGIVRAHGGEIRAEDRAGGGTRFVVWLPRGRAGARGAGA